jgi:hypothetical protein
VCEPSDTNFPKEEGRKFFRNVGNFYYFGTVCVWGYLKSRVFETRPATFDELKASIREAGS